MVHDAVSRSATRAQIVYEDGDARHLIVVDVLRLVGQLVVVAVAAGREKDDRNAVARILVVVAAAVVLRGMSVRVELVVEMKRRGFRLGDRLDQVAELRGQSARPDELKVSGATALLVMRSAAADHVHIELRDDRIAWDRGMVGEVLRSPGPLSSRRARRTRAIVSASSRPC